MHSSAWEIAEANVDTRRAAGKALLCKPCVHSSSCLLHFFQMRKLRRRRPRSRSPRGTRPGCSPGKRSCSLLGPGPPEEHGLRFRTRARVLRPPAQRLARLRSPLWRGHAGSTAVRNPHSGAPKRSSSSGVSLRGLRVLTSNMGTAGAHASQEEKCVQSAEPRAWRGPRAGRGPDCPGAAEPPGNQRELGAGGLWAAGGCVSVHLCQGRPQAVSENALP